MTMRLLTIITRRPRPKSPAFRSLLAGLVAGALLHGAGQGAFGSDWLQFRGEKSGVAAGEGPARLDHIAWTASLPGRGISGPIVVGDRVYVTASSGHDQERLHMLAIDKADGKVAWERQFWATGRTQCHPKMAVASSNPASDGQRILALYSTNDLACLDRDGKLLWFRGLTYEFPNASNSLGMASSPVVCADTVIVQVETDDDAFAMGIDIENGETRWKLDRPHRDNWTSPLVLRGADREHDVVVLQSSQGLIGIRPKTAEVVWTYTEGASTVSSSASGEGLLFVPSNGLTALSSPSPAAMPAKRWRMAPLGLSYASLLYYDGRVYSVTGAPVLIAADAKTGHVDWRLRLTGTFYSSPIAAGERMYFFNDAGLGQVVTLAKDRGTLANQRDFKEGILCTPALVDKALYVRSDQHLWKIAD
jgi:outer membrane protein assembly factor BamB